MTTRHRPRWSPNTLLNVRAWPNGLRFFCVWLPGLALTLISLWVADFLELNLNTYGWANASVVYVIITWYSVDALFPRRSVYYNFVFKDTEGPLRSEIRLWRKLAILTCGVLAIACAGIVLHPRESTDQLLPPEALRSLFVLSAAYLAALGWLYTTFEKEKSDRASNTLMAIRDQLYGGHIESIYEKLRLGSHVARSQYGLSVRDVLPMCAMECTLPLQGNNNQRSEPEKLYQVLDLFLNALNQLALGVRLGQFDLRTIELVLRPRFVRLTYVFSEYIIKHTEASYDENIKRWRSTVLTWEHLLWLTDQMPILATDNVHRDKIVLPPDRIIRPSVSSSLQKGRMGDATDVGLWALWT